MEIKVTHSKHGDGDWWQQQQTRRSGWSCNFVTSVHCLRLILCLWLTVMVFFLLCAYVSICRSTIPSWLSWSIVIPCHLINTNKNKNWKLLATNEIWAFGENFVNNNRFVSSETPFFRLKLWSWHLFAILKCSSEIVNKI